MNGKHHLIAGGAFGAAYAGSIAAACAVSPEFAGTFDFQFPGSLIRGALSIGLYGLGLLLPDCDNPNSMLGRYLYIPVEHRTWLHTFWFMIPFMILGCLFGPAHFIWAGIFVHLLCDSVSKCGICWLYPVSKYKHFGALGAKIKKGHFFRLYSSETGEAVVCAALWILLALPILILMTACLWPWFQEITGLGGFVSQFQTLCKNVFAFFNDMKNLIK